MPDATGLELLAQAVLERFGPGSVVATSYAHDLATLEIAPARVKDVLLYLRDEADEPYDFLASVHGCDYLPEEPRLGVHYELLSMERVERLNVKTRVPLNHARVPTVVDLFPAADYQEREVYDMFGVIFEGHPDLRRILMPEDYVGHPLRRDFPMGGEEVIFTFNEAEMPRWYD